MNTSYATQRYFIIHLILIHMPIIVFLSMLSIFTYNCNELRKKRRSGYVTSKYFKCLTLNISCYSGQPIPKVQYTETEIKTW